MNEEERRASWTASKADLARKVKALTDMPVLQGCTIVSAGFEPVIEFTSREDPVFIWADPVVEAPLYLADSHSPTAILTIEEAEMVIAALQTWIAFKKATEL
jgi:hypothetical protein